MIHKKDYTWALNRGLYKTFHNKYTFALYNSIKSHVVGTDHIPSDQNDLLQWVCTFVHDELNGPFKYHLIKQIIKSIKEAPDRSDDLCYDDN